MNPLVTTINGNVAKGKVVLIISGVHGNELTPIATTLALAEELAQSSLKDQYQKFVIVTGVNETALRAKVREAGVQHTYDLNRSFDIPFCSDIIGFVKDMIGQADIIIDIHSSPNITEMFLVNQDKYAHCMYKILDSLGLTYCYRPFNGNTIKKFALSLGKMGFTLELNGMDHIDDYSADWGRKYVIRLLSGIHDKELYEEDIDDSYTAVSMVSHAEGLLHYYVEPGDPVRAGCLLFDVKNYNGKTLYWGRSSVDGRVVGLEPTSWVNIGDAVILVQPVHVDYEYGGRIIPIGVA